MKVKEAVLCDVCRDRVAKNSCAFCGDDVCLSCLSFFTNKRNVFFQIPLCRDCLNKALERDRPYEEFGSNLLGKFWKDEFVSKKYEDTTKDFKNIFIDFAKKMMLSKKLKNGS